METIDVKEAVKRAKAVLLELYADEPPRELALEEIERTKESDREVWLVTLGFFRKKSINSTVPSTSSFSLPLRPTPVENRDYKTLQIDATTGEFVKMDMRIVQ